MRGFLLFLVLLPFTVCSQDIVGIYKPVKKSNDPQGGSIFFITEDDHWGAMAFGTALYGTIENVDGDALYKFTELKPKSQYSVYSRPNKKLKDSTRIFFSEFSSGRHLIHFNDSKVKLPKTYDVYNAGANCFSFPAVSMLSGLKSNFSLAIKEWSRTENSTYTFYNYKNSKRHNDIVILNTSEVFNKKSTQMIAMDSQLFEPSKSSRGYKKVSTDAKELTELQTLLERVIEYPDTIYLSNNLKQLSTYELKEGGWNYNLECDCYTIIDVEKAKEDEPRSTYNYPVIMYPYRLISNSAITNTEIKSPKISLLYSSCEEE